LRSEGDPRNIAPTVGTGGPPGGPTGLFTIYDGQTLRKGEFTFSFAYSNYDRDPGNVDLTEVPVSFQIGLSDHLELFFNTDAYRGVKVNNPQNLSSFYLPNSQLFLRALNPNGTLGPNMLQSPGAVVLAPNNNAGIIGTVFRPVGNQPFVQFPFVGGTAGNFASGFAGVNSQFTFTLGTPSGNTGNFDAAGNFPGIGSIFGSILPATTDRCLRDVSSSPRVSSAARRSASRLRLAVSAPPTGSRSTGEPAVFGPTSGRMWLEKKMPESP